MRWLRPLLFAASASASVAATFTWTGAAGDGHYTNPNNWAGGVAPPNNGTADVVFAGQGPGTVTFPAFSFIDVASIQFSGTSATPYEFQGLAWLNIHDGLRSSTPAGVSFSSGILINLTDDSQTLRVDTGTMRVAGAVIGSAALNKTGSGQLVLGGLNLYSGGTHVEAGSLTFTSALAVPQIGRIAADDSAYVGITFNQAVQGAFLDQLDASAFRGTIGFDTSAGQSAPTIFSDRIDLSALTNYAAIGTDTSARLTGELKIGSQQTYRFGGGGSGTLYVEGGLTGQGKGVQLTSAFGTPMTLVLRGTNSFSGTVDILHSILLLDSAQALAGNNSTGDTRRLNLLGPAYVGYTENFAHSTANFLGRIDKITSANAIVGIDSANLAQPRTVDDAIDLSMGGTRTDPYYLGTSTRVTLTGQITPTVGDSLHLTAIKGGHLHVASTLGETIPGVVIGQGSSFERQGGTVELSGNNRYTGGTTVRGGTLLVSHNNALGLGGVAVGDRGTLNVAQFITLSNPLTLSGGSVLTGRGTLATPGGVIIGLGAHLAPGGVGNIGSLSFSTGLTFGPGGYLDLDILSIPSGAGVGWDTLNVNGGALRIVAPATQPFTLNLHSLSANGVNGPISIFDSAQSYQWTFLVADSIEGFSSDTFAINAAGFLNYTGGGQFFVTQDGLSLTLNFTPVPEPSTYALMLLGLGAVLVVEYRRRRHRR